jgi:hypothetical protein
VSFKSVDNSNESGCYPFTLLNKKEKKEEREKDGKTKGRERKRKKETERDGKNVKFV